MVKTFCLSSISYLVLNMGIKYLKLTLMMNSISIVLKEMGK